MDLYVSHIASNINIIGTLPVDIHRGVRIRRATPPEIEDHNTRLHVLSTGMIKPSPSYRHIFRETLEGTSTVYQPELLPEQHWRYWVVCVSNEGPKFSTIEKLLNLCEPCIMLGFTRIYDSAGELAGVRPLSGHIFNRITHFPEIYSTPQSIEISTIADVFSYVDSLERPDPDFLFVTASVNKFFDLQRLPSNSDMYLLGLFSVIESLIAHKPRLTESLDSINHQLIHKMHMIDENFLKDPVSIDRYFGQIQYSSLWKKLYSVRSAIAHTSSLDLSSEHQALRSKENVISYMECKTRELLLLAFQRPKLLRDLKAC
jgi:hypothetical protein